MAILEYQRGRKDVALEMLEKMHLNPSFALEDLQIMEALVLSNKLHKMIKIDSTTSTHTVESK